MTRNLAEFGILVLVLVILIFQSIGLATERSNALEYVHLHGSRCMALFDPTMTTDSVKGVDPQTAVYLQRVAPQASAFFHSHWSAGVTLLDQTTFRGCFGPNARSVNPVGTDAIFLNRDLLPSPQLRALAIAHELIHAEHNDYQVINAHSIRHLFITEEGEAHWADQKAAFKLHMKSLDPPIIAGLIWIAPLPLLYALLAFTAYRSLLFARRHSQATLRRTIEEAHGRYFLPPAWTRKR